MISVFRKSVFFLGLVLLSYLDCFAQNGAFLSFNDQSLFHNLSNAGIVNNYRIESNLAVSNSNIRGDYKGYNFGGAKSLSKQDWFGATFNYQKFGAIDFTVFNTEVFYAHAISFSKDLKLIMSINGGFIQNRIESQNMILIEDLLESNSQDLELKSARNGWDVGLSSQLIGRNYSMFVVVDHLNNSGLVQVRENSFLDSKLKSLFLIGGKFYLEQEKSKSAYLRAIYVSQSRFSQIVFGGAYLKKDFDLGMDLILFPIDFTRSQNSVKLWSAFALQNCKVILGYNLPFMNAVSYSNLEVGVVVEM